VERSSQQHASDTANNAGESKISVVPDFNPVVQKNRKSGTDEKLESLMDLAMGDLCNDNLDRLFKHHILILRRLDTTIGA